MELKEQGMSMRLSLVLGNALVLNCAALALTATMLSSLLELFSQASFFYFQLFFFFLLNKRLQVFAVAQNNNFIKIDFFLHKSFTQIFLATKLNLDRLEALLHQNGWLEKYIKLKSFG
jgi:hypothetical protein